MSKEVIVQTPNHTADVKVTTEHDVIVKPRNFILSSAACTSILDGTVIPDWMNEAITNMVASGLDGTTRALNALDDFTRQLETGVTQQITAVQTEAESKYQLLTQDVARLDNDVAAIATLAESKVNAEGASALFTSLLTAQFNDVNSDANAWVVEQTAALSNAVSANASSLQLLTADYNGLAVSIQTIDQVQAGLFSEWDGVSTPKLGQFKLIGTTYYQYLGGTLGELNDGWVQTDKSAEDLVTNVNNTLTQYVDDLVGDLQNQIDGNITTWFDDYTPTNTTEPWASWLATDTTNGDTAEQDKHTGDIFYDTSTGYGYRFINTAGVYSWSLITDNAITQALAAASTAQETADGKVTVWYQSSAPTGLTVNDIGDMWVDTANSNITKVWNGTAWEDQTNAIANQASTWAANASKLITDPITDAITGWQFADASNTPSQFKFSAQHFKFDDGSGSGLTPFEIDATNPANPLINFIGKVSFTNVTDVPVINQTFTQASAPISGMIAGDTWIDTDDNNKVYNYDGSTWIPISTVGSTTFMQTTEPTSGITIGDIWIDTDDNYKQYRYNGTSWVAIAYNPATAINSNTTTIDGGKITTNSLSANRLQPSIGDSTVWSGGALVSSDFDGFKTGDIGTPTTGFRLAADAAGTFNDPTIYGAFLRGSYIYGATMESSEMFVRDLRVLTDGGQETDVFLYGAVLGSKGSNLTTPHTASSWRFGVQPYNSTDTSGMFKLASPTVNEAVFNHGSGAVKIGTDINYTKNQTLQCTLWIGDTAVETVGVYLDGGSGTTNDDYARFNHGFDLFFSYYTSGSSSPAFTVQIYICEEDSTGSYGGAPAGNYYELRNFSGTGELKLTIEGNFYDSAGYVSHFPIFVSNI